MATTITANGINFPDGSAGSPSIGGSDTNTGLFTGSDIVGFATGGSERLRIDASGNVNIANDSGKLQLGTGADLQIYHDGTNTYLDNNTGQFNIDAASGNAIRFLVNGSYQCQVYTSGIDLPDNKKLRLGDSEDLQIYHDPQYGHSFIKESGPGGLIFGASLYEFYNAAINEKMFTATENGAIELYHDNVKHFETTSIGCKIADNDTTAALQFANSDGDNGYVMGESTNIIGFKDNQAHWLVKAFKDGAVELYYDNSLKARTDNNGFVVDGRFVTDGDYNYLQGNSTSVSTLTLKKSASGADSIDYLQLRNNANEMKLNIEGDGDVKNLNNSYGSLSDVNLKENIVDAKSQWDDIKNVKVRNFNFKDDTKKTKMLGVVAQEIETVSAGLVSESIDKDPDTNEDLGTTTKSVKYSILYMKAIKCLQEAMAKIEVLEAKVEALEAA